MFSCLRSLTNQNKNEYEKQIYLTFDIDWACDTIIYDTLQILNNYNASATLFVTHNSDIFEKIGMDDKNIELGIHPNFNYLLSPQSATNEANIKKIVCDLLKFIPQPISARSHSLTSSSHILQSFTEVGIKIDANIYIPWHSGVTIHPFYSNKILRCPHFFADDDYASIQDIKLKPSAFELLCRDGLKIFDFHPIHVFLNTENIERYERTRHLHKHPDKLIKHRFEGYGIRNLLIDILKNSKKLDI